MPTRHNKIAGRLPQHRHHALHHAMRPRIRPRRNIDWPNAFPLQQLSNAEDMVGIADRDATVQAVGAHDDRDSHRRLRRIPPLSFGDQVTLRDAAMHEVIAAHAALAEVRIPGRAAGSNEDRSDAKPEKIKSMIEPGAEHRGRMAGIFGGAEDDDRIRAVHFL